MSAHYSRWRLPELKALPRTRVEVKEDGRTLVYEGVLVGEILRRCSIVSVAGLAIVVAASAQVPAQEVGSRQR